MIEKNVILSIALHIDEIRYIILHSFLVQRDN